MRQVLRVVLNEESYQFGLEMQFRDPIRSATPRTIIEAEECERIIGRRTIFARDMTLSVRSKVIACMRKGNFLGDVWMTVKLAEGEMSSFYDFMIAKQV